MVWKTPEESAPKKAKVTISAGKVMAIVFWDCKGVLLVDYLPPNTTDNAARYCEVLTKLRAAIKRKRPGLLSRKVSLVYDNTHPHAARTTQMLLENFKWEILTHPPYSSDLAPSDFHLFSALKLHLGGKHFANDDEVQAEANHWLRRQDTAWYNSGIKKLLQRYQKCLDRNDQKNWDEILPFITHAYNTTIQEITGYSPFFLLFGREPMSLLDDENIPMDSNMDDHDEYIENYLDKIARTRQVVINNTEKTQERMKRKYDKNTMRESMNQDI
ncbi:hypothetical protein LAZ67_21002171 [Cordylochernes scorpioides]|uniref:Transposase n=1 Tax=Cordylochernes scorpioides TaxID=51811 RepID=A0ABY6LML3_9ARAC|nr:hypothetical protein LAZ67_21002171 [Cordylochernes scorpioides]